ncbi:hypothetical protein BS47DRAFT_321853 [Hydnum rufescens UP504]|uniref:Uncharacterized protein n=1 Tax=Hydnum rufescens UP504 TaxID=1448309 RepID=A0A9P6AK11_9AGAM|nr:hypothetical protein BS47DRAFT_321853 [Hydnum rufescens UP504]
MTHLSEDAILVASPLKNVMRQLRAEGYTHVDSPSPGRHGDSSMSASHQDAGSNESPISSSSKDAPWPTDPAIVSASRPPDKDHLSRLLGGLSFSNTSAPTAASTVRNQVDGALPTPLATPSASAAIRNDIEHASGIHMSSAHTIPSNISIVPLSFASPTPPQSGNSLKSSALPQPLNESKPKFEFISPFDAFVSPTIATKQSVKPSSSKAEGRPQALTVASSTPSSLKSGKEAEPSKNRSVSSPTPQRSGFVPDHFVPASVSRAQFASGKRGSLSSQPSSESPLHNAKRPLIAESTGPGSPTGSELDPNRRAQHFALLQGVASDIMTKSLPRTHSTGSPRRNDSPFVVRPHATPERPLIPSHIPIFSHPSQVLSSFASFRSTPPATDPRFRNSAPYSPHRSVMPHNSGVFPGAPVPSSYPGAPAPGPQPFIGLDTKQSTVPLPPSVSIPVAPPATPMQRGELLSLLNEGRQHPNTPPLAPFGDPQARRSQLGLGPVALGPPVPGLESLESPFVVKPPPPLNRPFPPPSYQPAFPNLDRHCPCQARICFLF